MWTSGGSIYYALKVTDRNTVFAVFKLFGKLTMHYYAGGNKKARTVSYRVGGIGRCQT